MKKIGLCAFSLFATMALAVWRGPDTAGMDPATAPGNDIFRYANGAWLNATEIPADRATYGTGEILADLTTQRVSDLLKQAAAQNAPAGTEAQQVADYYASFMDEATIESKGVAPLKPELARIAAISNRQQLSQALGSTLHRSWMCSITPIFTRRIFSDCGSRRT